MKKEFIAVLTITLMSALCFAKPHLVMDGNAKKFLKNRHHHVYKSHDAAAAQDASSFVVKIDESSQKTMTDLKNLLKNTYDVGTYKNDPNVSYFKNERIRVDISDLETDREKCAQRVLNKIVPAKYAGQFKIVSVDEEWGYSETEPAKITAYTLNFKRLFKGRVVRNRDNYLNIDLDSDGRFKGADVALQDFELTTETVTTDESSEENEATLDSLLSSEPSDIKVVADDGLLKSKRMENVEVGSVAEAYCEVEDGSVKKLFPCLSYASTVNLEDGGQVSRIIDVPHSRGSWHHNRKGKKPVKFHRFNH